ncbi:hypothetical protein CKF58_03475 [Psittacicella hinzii]|uniref:Uncharacterized protein n=1 Tax=Psittacicella hinzii TaxID=2028575 RepID=A0A3A1YP67_9GAMM|nr:hypothetical protein CKF58_03475 [Psittacicella hinzii]
MGSYLVVRLYHPTQTLASTHNQEAQVIEKQIQTYSLKHSAWPETATTFIQKLKDLSKERPYLSVDNYYSALAEFYALINTSYSLDINNYHSESMNDFVNVVKLCRVALLSYPQIYDQQPLCNQLIPLSIVSGLNENHWQTLGLLGLAKSIHAKIQADTATNLEKEQYDLLLHLAENRLPFKLAVLTYNDISEYIGLDYIQTITNINLVP